MSSIIRAMKQSFIRYPLQEIFRAASHVAILRVLNQLTGGISGRELARRAEINDRTCRLSLKRLEYLNVIEYLGSGKTKLVRLNRQSFFTKSIISGLFEAERDYLKSVVVSIQNVIQENCGWACIYGSVAKRTDTVLSDLDLLIIISDAGKFDLMQDITSELSIDIFSKFGLSLSPLILTATQWTGDKQFMDLKIDIVQHHIQLAGKRPAL